MYVQDYLHETLDWHEVTIDANVSLYAVLLWCMKYDSPHGCHVVVDDSLRLHEYESAKLRFQSREDAVMFSFIWCGVNASD